MLREEVGITVVLAVVIFLCSSQVHAQTELSTSPWWKGISVEHLGALIIAIVAVILAYAELRAHRLGIEKVKEIEVQRAGTEQAAAEKRIELEEKRFKAEQDVAEKRAEFEERRLKVEEDRLADLKGFREEETKRFSRTGVEIARHVARSLVDHPDWAHQALEAAKLLPYTYTIFGERSQHFREEKEELAKRFVPYLLKRCEALAEDDRDVFLLIDAGTTLYSFFEVIGRETVKCYHRGDNWLRRFHLVTNNLPGIEQLIRTGRRVQEDRYSELAIGDCHLLPGHPIPIFAAVAGPDTNEAIINLRAPYQSNDAVKPATFIALVVGNWIRIRKEPPRCPVPLARGKDHLGVKRTLVKNVDEIYVVSPLGKIIVNHSRDELNNALGFVGIPRDPESEPYEDVDVEEQAPMVKLVSTKRSKGHLLQRHSNSVEDALIPGSKATLPSDQEFASAKIEDVPHLLFDFGAPPRKKYDEFIVEFPHYHTRRNRKFLDMFFVDPDDI